MLERIKKIKKLLIVQEGTRIGSWGSEVLSQLSEINIEGLVAENVSNEGIIPAAIAAEKASLVSKERILMSASKLMRK